MSTPADAVSTAPAAPYNAFTANTPVTNGAGNRSVEIDQTNGAAPSATAVDTDGIDFEMHDSANAHQASFIVVPPTGSTLAVGSTSVSGYAGTRSATSTTASVGLDGQYWRSSGTVSISDLTRDVSGTLTSFAADYSMADGNGSVITGSVRYNSAQDFLGRTADTAQIAETGLVGNYGPNHTITLTGAGSTPLQVGASSIGGANPADFAVQPSSTCTNAALSYGQTCTVVVRSQPHQAGTRTAVVSIADNTAAGSLQIPLVVTATTPGAGTFHPLPPTRILDTRSNNRPLTQQGIRDVAVLGHGGVPSSGVSSVVINLTVAGSSAGGYVTAYPNGQPRPGVSSINFPARWVGANMVTVAPGTSGMIDLFNAFGNTAVVIDVLGFYASDETLTQSYGVGGNYRFSSPAARVLDTRTWGYGALPGGFEVRLAPDYGTAADPHIRAFAVNITVVNPSATGYLTAWAGNTAPPTASTLNFVAHQTVPNMAIVPTEYCSNCGNASESFQILNHSTGAANIVVDVVGFFDDGTYGGSRFHPIVPTRIVDTRSNLGGPRLTPPTANETNTIVPPSAVAGADTVEMVQNVTAVLPSAGTFLTLWPAYSGSVQPHTSNVNANAGQTVANAAITPLGDNNAFHITNGNGTVNVLVDATGRFDAFPSFSFGLNPVATALALRSGASAGSGSASAATGATMVSGYHSAPLPGDGR